MGAFMKIGILAVVVIAVLVAWCGVRFTTPEMPKVPTRSYWGPGDARPDDETVRPFKVNVPQNVIDDLKKRLEATRPFITPLEGVKHHYGINTQLLNKIIEYWRTKYDWKQRQAYLNSLPQFQTQISGLNIHFIHAKPKSTGKNVKTLPLLLVHGWPGSVVEFYELIELLTTPRGDYVFEVIAPSMPGYGFSQAASKPGMNPAEMGAIFSKLMNRLGHKQYYLQGGDWGAAIVRLMASLFEKEVLGVHSNMCFVNTPLAQFKRIVSSFVPSLFVNPLYQDRMYPLTKYFKIAMLEFGYMHLQATKPDTVGVGLNDSPAGLAAYILEKFITWTNPNFKDRDDGALAEKYGYDKLLDNVMLYWVTNSISTSMRLYAECFNSDFMDGRFEAVPVTVPSACANFKYEIFYTPEFILKDTFLNLMQNTHYDDGGHFIAMEQPKMLANDLHEAVQHFREFNARPKH